ncbi:H-type small acid-soluble spore protein [Bacillus solitudinis]|uniref:H-type small acid-soluble spore protein n=1 Tax=Bacillus solitudinis TaxID=2014074 RepID=UPI0038736025
MMDINRAKQIISSSAEIDVTYMGQSVWLLNTDEKSNTVSVKTMTKDEDILDLPVDTLEENS